MAVRVIFINLVSSQMSMRYFGVCSFSKTLKILSFPFSTIKDNRKIMMFEVNWETLGLGVILPDHTREGEGRGALILFNSPCQLQRCLF